MLKIIERTKVWFTLSLTIIILGLIFSFVRGINLGIDFKGGTLITVDMKGSFNKPDLDQIITKYAKDYESNVANTTQLEIKINNNALDEKQISSMINDIKAKYKSATLLSQETIGPSVGSDLQQKAIMSLSIAILCMLVYIGIRFELKFGAAAVVALVHDVLITLSVYIIFHIPINLSFIAAMLTIIGYSMNDTIVIFDRIRENLNKTRRASLTEIVDKSITQTILRSIFTVTTTLITTTCVYIFVPAIREFALPLIIGIASGCYSSIFIASPFWVIFKNKSLKKATA